MTRLHVRIVDPVLGTARATVGTTPVDVVDIGRSEAGRDRLVVRVPDGHREAFGAALGEDPTVTSWRRISGDDGGVFRVDLSDVEGVLCAYRLLHEADGVPLHLGGSADGWCLRALFPSRPAATDFVTACDRADVDLTIQSVYAGESHTTGGTSDLTPAQAETLRVAVDAGYYEVPRRATLSDLACVLDVSEQAVSERLRRGLRSVLSDTVGDGKPTDRFVGRAGTDNG